MCCCVVQREVTRMPSFELRDWWLSARYARKKNSHLTSSSGRLSSPPHSRLTPASPPSSSPSPPHPPCHAGAHGWTDGFWEGCQRFPRAPLEGSPLPSTSNPPPPTSDPALPTFPQYPPPPHHHDPSLQTAGVRGNSEPPLKTPVGSPRILMSPCVCLCVHVCVSFTQASGKGLADASRRCPAAAPGSTTTSTTVIEERIQRLR